MARLRTRVAEARAAFRASADGRWEPFYLSDAARSATANIDPENFTPEAGLQLAPMFGAVDYLCRAASRADRVLEELVGGEWRRVRDLTLGPPWLMRPNVHQTWRDMIDLLVRNMLVTGNGFTTILTRDGSVPESIMSLPTDLVQINQSTSAMISGQQQAARRVSYSVAGRAMLPYTRYTPEGELQHFKLGTRREVLWGTSPLAVAAPGLRAALGADAFAELFFAGGGGGQIVFQKPPTSKDVAQATEKLETLGDEYRESRRDPRKRHHPTFARGELGVIDTRMKPADSQMDESRQLGWRQASAISGIPRPLIGGDDSAAWANAIRQLMRGTNINAVEPRMAYVGEVLSELLPDDMRVRLRHDQHSDLEPIEKAQYYTMLADSGVISRERAAIEMGFDPKEVPDEAPGVMSDPTGGRSRSGRPVGTRNVPDGPPAERQAASVNGVG